MGVDHACSVCYKIGHAGTERRAPGRRSPRSTKTSSRRDRCPVPATHDPEGHPMHPTIRTVLVTGAGGPAGTSAVHQLLDRGMRVIATDITPLAFPAEDFLLGPRAESPSYIPFLEETVARLGVDLLVPTVQEELPALAAAAPILGCRVASAAAGPVLLCHDKLLTMRFLAACGIPVPSTATVRPSGVSPQRVRERPFVVKPRLSRGSRGAVVLEDRKSTRLNSSHVAISYAVFCLQKQNPKTPNQHAK